MAGEYIVASPQQKEAIASFNSSRPQRHLVLTGAAGTGKTLVASQMANNLIQSLEATAEQCPLPVLVTEVVPDGQFVSNVKGKKPIVFDVGKDEDEGGASKESGSL